MRYPSIFICLFFLLPASQVLAQSTPAANTTAPPLNQVDKQGKPNGMWWIEQPPKMGEDGFTEFGTYIHGRKYGTWYKIDGEGNMAAIEQYKNGILNGEVKYFERGQLTSVGNYRGLNPDQKYDTIYVEDPGTHEEFKRILPSERGALRHGMWRYYDPKTGRLLREEDYTLDELVYRKDFTVAPVDSAYYKQRLKEMPHNQKNYYKPPKGKNGSNTY